MSEHISDFLHAKVYGSPFLANDWKQFLILQHYHVDSAIIRAETYFRDTYTNNYIALVRDLVFAYIVLAKLHQVYIIIRGYGLITAFKVYFKKLQRAFFKFILSFPPIKSKVDKELSETIAKMSDSIIKNDDRLLQLTSLPPTGLPDSEIIDELDKLQELEHTDWTSGRVSGAVYHGGELLLKLQSEAYYKYSISNQLHPDVFPGVRKMEAEVVSMVLKLFNAPETGCGSTTSGGTESLLLTGLAAREYGRKYKRITKGEIIAPITVHAGIEKACSYFGMKLHKVELDKDYKVNIKKVKQLINSNTVLLVGSAPNYPHGIIDDIEGLSKLAIKYNIPLHVDACLGSFIVSFLSKSKVHGDKVLPKFDFQLPGVSSISCDTHKYGFAPKGSSIIMYRTPKLRECQYYISTDWTGGLYGSPTLAGSRPGALMVGCWATLVSIGEEGYKKSCYDIVSASMKLKQAIREHPILSKYTEVIGEPIGSVISFKLKDSYKGKINIYEVSESLSKDGWHFAALQNPSALHFALTRLTIPVIDELIEAVATALVKAATLDNKSLSETSAIYGVAGSVKTTGVADKLIVGFLDTLYKV